MVRITIYDGRIPSGSMHVVNTAQQEVPCVMRDRKNNIHDEPLQREKS
jgi:hypothetical protein